jgi:hypothetical protein
MDSQTISAGAAVVSALVAVTALVHAVRAKKIGRSRQRGSCRAAPADPASGRFDELAVLCMGKGAHVSYSAAEGTGGAAAPGAASGGSGGGSVFGAGGAGGGGGGSNS